MYGLKEVAQGQLKTPKSGGGGVQTQLYSIGFNYHQPSIGVWEYAPQDFGNSEQNTAA